MMAHKKPIVVFIFSRQGSENSTRYGGFAKRLLTAGGLENYELKTAALENILYVLDEKGTMKATDLESGFDFSDVDYVYFRSWTACRDEAVVLANYLLGKGIPFADSQVLATGGSKVSTLTKLWRQHLPFPSTIYTLHTEHLVSYLINKRPLSEPFILKDIYGSKGINNFLVKYDELTKITKANPEIQFMAQRYIPNDGDYRVGVYFGLPSLFMHRSSSLGSHLHNVSTGAIAKIMSAGEVPNELAEIALKATRAVGLEVAGVDIVFDKDTNLPYVLEVNRSSQVVTGALVSEKITLFNQALMKKVGRRIRRRSATPLSLIGRRAPASLPDLGIMHVIAKIDTGAISSTLHAENIRIEQDSSGNRELVFDIVPRDGFITEGERTITIRTVDFTRKKVTSTIGISEERYAISTKIVIGGREITDRLTLTDRTSMRYPLLIGRRLLRSHFLVNIELDEGKDNKRSFRTSSGLARERMKA